MGVEIQYEPESGDSVTGLIVETVADLTDKPALNLPPLYDSVDPDAVDRLFTHNGGQELQLNFTYYGFEVTVESIGNITLEETD